MTFNHTETALSSDYIIAFQRLAMARSQESKTTLLKNLINVLFTPIIQKNTHTQNDVETAIKEEETRNNSHASAMINQIFAAYKKNMSDPIASLQQQEFFNIYYQFVREFVDERYQAEKLKSATPAPSLPQPTQRPRIIIPPLIIPAPTREKIKPVKKKTFVFPISYIKWTLYGCALATFIILMGLTFGGVLSVAALPGIGPLYHAIATGGSFKWGLYFTSLSISKKIVASTVSVILGAFMIAGIAKITMMFIVWKTRKEFSRRAANQFVRPVSRFYPNEIDNQQAMSLLYGSHRKNGDEQTTGLYLYTNSRVLVDHLEYIVSMAECDQNIKNALNNMASKLVYDENTNQLKNRDEINNLKNAFDEDFNLTITMSELLEWRDKYMSTTPESVENANLLSDSLLGSMIYQAGESSSRNQNR